MKGGKAGRPRKSATGAAGRDAAGRGKSRKGSAPRPASSAPKKGSRKRPDVGGMSTSRDE